MPERVERRREPRTRVDQLYSVEFLCPGDIFIYRFKIWDISSKGIAILVRDDSEVLKHLKVGDVIEMKYYATDTSVAPEHLRTQIKHITQDKGGRFKGHRLVGLEVLGRATSE